MDKSDTIHYLASTWLEHQELSEKSPTEILDMYFNAKQQIEQAYSEKHASKAAPRTGRKVRSSGLEIDN